MSWHAITLFDGAMAALAALTLVLASIKDRSRGEAHWLARGTAAAMAAGLATVWFLLGSGRIARGAALHILLLILIAPLIAVLAECYRSRKRHRETD
ncbi:MAG TPA: hypothetical protein VFJ58_04530 [Armatimonadota bacterium]|nr:hypothetical protein [Armatimonadota bacterium]